jgi:hypothetical protein
MIGAWRRSAALLPQSACERNSWSGPVFAQRKKCTMPIGIYRVPELFSGTAGDISFITVFRQNSRR